MSEMQKSKQTEIIEQVLITGNLASLNPQQRVEYYNAVCGSMGLNPLTRPFDYITLNGKLTLYARKDAADQLRKLHGVSIVIKEQKEIDGIYVVTANGKDKTGKEDEDVGAVNVAGLKGEAKANAIMKAITKAKRRVTLSVCGLGMLDETEVDSIPGAHIASEQAQVATEQKKEAIKEKIMPKKEVVVEAEVVKEEPKPAPVPEREDPAAFMESKPEMPPPAPKAAKKDPMDKYRAKGIELLSRMEAAANQDELNVVIQEINREIKPDGSFPLAKIPANEAKAFKEQVASIRDSKKLDFEAEKKVLQKDEISI